MKIFVTYLTKYSGSKLPPYYIGSTSEENALSGNYYGSVNSKEWKNLFNIELKENPHLFSLEVLSYHKNRKEALEEELRVQIERNVVQSDQYFNKSLARVNGFFGMKINGENHPIYGKNHSDETKRKISEIQTGRSFLERSNGDKEKAEKWKKSITKGLRKAFKGGLSEEHKKKLSDVHTGRILTKEWRENISKGQKGRKAWNKGIRTIHQLDLEGNFIKEWESFQDIKDELGLPQSNLCKCCQGQRNKVGGFKWKYIDNEAS